MKPHHVFLEHWNKIKDHRVKDYQIIEDFILHNDSKADIAIFLEDQCMAYGSFFTKLKLPKAEGDRFYFHRENSFIGCGTESKFWFYFDNDQIIINDHKWKYPYDELMDNYDMLFDRLIQEY